MLLISDTISTVAQFITVVLLFFFVLAITYFATRYMAGTQKSRLKGDNIQIVDTQRISQNGYVQILKVGEKYVSIVVSKDNVIKLCEHAEEELTLTEDGAMNVPDFSQILHKVIKKNEKQ